MFKRAAPGVDDLFVEGERSRWTFRAALIGCSVLLMLLTLGVMWFLLLVVLLGPCSGDGGAPYARAGSDLARACTVLDPPAVGWALLLGPAAFVVAGAVVAWLRRSFVPLLAAWGVGLCSGAALPFYVLLIDGPEQRAQVTELVV